VDAFLLKFKHTAGIDADALARLESYSWPGNVRELENAVERAVIMAGNGKILPAHLPPHVRDNKSPGAPRVFTLPPEGVSLDGVEKNLILQALDMARGSKTNAAKLLGISRRALYSKMNTHGIAVGGKEEDGADPAERLP
jgi:two-component system NtrC family response regulator